MQLEVIASLYTGLKNKLAIRRTCLQYRKFFYSALSVSLVHKVAVAVIVKPLSFKKQLKKCKIRV